MIRRDVLLAEWVRIHRGCYHVWIAGREELAGENKAWLREAACEREIKGYSGMNRRDLIENLLEWETRRCTELGIPREDDGR